MNNGKTKGCTMSKKSDPNRDNEEITDIESCPNEPVGNETTENEKTMGNRRCTRGVIASIIFVTMAAIIAVAVIYGRPPSWKKSRDFPQNCGNLLDWSEDGTILAMGSSSFDSVKNQTEQRLDGVKIYDVQSGDQIGQRIPFFDINDPTLPNADHWSRTDWYVLDEDLSLSSDGRTLVVSSVTVGYAKTSNNTLCGGEKMSCYFGRVSIYDFDGLQWVNTNNGPIYEHLVPTYDEWGGTLRVALSGDKSTLATWTNRIISDDGVVGANIMMFDRDEDTGEYMEGIGNSIHIDKIWYSSTVSLSINEVGSRIAIGGFDGVELYDYNALDGKWGNIPGPGKMDGYHITSAVLSDSGSRMAVSMRFNGNNFGDEEPDYLRVYKWTTTGDGWVQIGNSVPEKVWNDSSGSSASGLTMSGDGNAISMSRYIDWDDFLNGRRATNVFRLSKNEEEWMEIGTAITGTLGSQYSALSYDGNRIATGPNAGSWRDNPFVTVYDLQRGI